MPPQTTRYTDGSARPQTRYSYRVRATNRYASGWTNEVSVTTGASP